MPCVPSSCIKVSFMILIELENSVYGEGIQKGKEVGIWLLGP
jgi:hypothetical protein